MICSHCGGNILITDDDGDIYCLLCTRYLLLPEPVIVLGRKRRDDKWKGKHE